MEKRKRVLFIASTVLFLIILPIVAQLPKATASTDDTVFSVMQISDTQFLSKAFPQLYTDTTTWIVNNAPSYNLKMVIHTGDIVDNIGDSNHPDQATADPTQWSNANNAMALLLNVNIPYCWDAGNHDQIPWNSPTGTWTGSSYAAFDVTSMRSKPYWVSDNNDGKNTAVKFTCNGYSFLIINVEYMASDSTLTWMKNLLNNNLDKNVIIAAHTYLNKSGGYGFSSTGLPGEVAWCTNFKTILDSYPNIFLTLNGHDPTGSAYSQKLLSPVNREEIFFDRQVITTTASQTNGGPYGQTGAAAVRIYTFDLSTKTVSTKTYCLDTQSWLTSGSNQFTFSANLKMPSELVVTPEYPMAILGPMTITFAIVCYYMLPKLKSKPLKS